MTRRPLSEPVPDAGPRPVDLAEWDTKAQRRLSVVSSIVGPVAVPPDVLATLVACARALRVLVASYDDPNPAWWPELAPALAVLPTVIDTAAPGAGGSKGD